MDMLMGRIRNGSNGLWNPKRVIGYGITNGKWEVGLEANKENTT